MNGSFVVLLVASAIVLIQTAEGQLNCPTISIENGTTAKDSRGVVTVLCDVGFNLVGSLHLRCLTSGVWNVTVPSCIRDCGRPSIRDEILWDLSNNSTLEGSTVIFKCTRGYEISSNKTLTCHRNGSWIGTWPTCIPTVDCGEPGVPENGHVSTEGGTLLGATSLYTCEIGYLLKGSHVIRKCQVNGSWSGSVPSCGAQDSMMTCPSDTDERGTTWQKYAAGETSVMFCQAGSSGNISRDCGINGQWKRPRYSCVRSMVRDVQMTVAALPDKPTEEALLAVSKDLSAVSNASTSSDPADTLTDEEISILGSALEIVASEVQSNAAELDNIANNGLDTASNLIDQANKIGWKTLEELYLEVSFSGDTDGTFCICLLCGWLVAAAVSVWFGICLHIDNKGADQVMGAVETLAQKEATQFKDKLIVKTNLALEINKTQGEIAAFPPGDLEIYPNGRFQSTKSGIRVQATQFAGQEFVYFGILYNNMTDIIAAKEENNESETEKIVNGPVVSLTLISPPGNFTPTVTYVIEHTVEGYSQPSCSFWVVNSTGRGYWSPDGCSVVSSNDSITQCMCDHLTNFAVLMSPFVSADDSSKALHIITVVGIAVSLFCLVVTLFVHLCFFRYLRSDRVALLISLCIALIIAYIVFLVGIDLTESEVTCKCVAAVLHYIFLVVFFIMLVEGINITFSVVLIFNKKKRIKHLLAAAWLIPAIIVGVSLGITKTDGYGNDDFCWLSIDDGLIWAFVGPAAGVIVVNVVILIVAIYKLMQLQSVKQKTKVEKAKTSVWSLCVLLPLMGISWILGIFYINENFYWMQYLFSICNGLQGFFIFVIHCVLNNQLRRAYKRANDKRKRSAEMKHTLKVTMRNTSSGQKYAETSSPIDQSIGTSHRSSDRS